MELAKSLEQLPFARWVAESDWAFPILETVHVMAISLVVGSISMIDLRLLGIGSKARSVSALTGQILPWTWTAFGVALTVGGLMFSSKATSYLGNPFFRAKLVCLALAGINMLVFHLLTARNMARWDVGVTPVAAKFAGASSLCLWITIVALGRWTGFY